MLHKRVKLRQGYRRKGIIEDIITSSAGDFARLGSVSSSGRKADMDEKWARLASGFAHGVQFSSTYYSSEDISEKFMKRR